MLDGFCYFVGIMFALAATILVAFPDFLVPDAKARKKRIGIRQWGIYHGSAAPEEEGEEELGIEVKIPARKEKAMYGSATYQAGRGVRMG